MTELTGNTSPNGHQKQSALISRFILEADTIRILIATDNHVGYEERDAIRKDDSWRTFDEILNLARIEDACQALFIYLFCLSIFLSTRLYHGPCRG